MSPIQNISKEWGYSSVALHLPGMRKALSSIPGTKGEKNYEMYLSPKMYRDLKGLIQTCLWATEEICLQLTSFT